MRKKECNFMNKNQIQRTTVISRVFAVVLFASILALACILPPVVESLCGTRDLLGDRANMGRGGEIFVLAVAYCMLAVAAFAIAELWRLLGVVSRGEVFSGAAHRLLLAVSLCCFGEGVLFLSLVYYFQLALGAAVGICFVGLCLLVVKNVIEEACRIKAENDFTV